MTKPCKDCIADDRIKIKTARPAVYPGPRCATHWRIKTKLRKSRAHELRIENGYQMPKAVYDALYEAQGGVCWVCRVATGAAKRLAVEHDHRCQEGHPPEQGCPKCWRALTCGRCNRLVAFLGPEALARAIELLVDPPAQRLLKPDEI